MVMVWSSANWASAEPIFRYLIVLIEETLSVTKHKLK